MNNYLIYGWKVQTDFEFLQLPVWDRKEGEQADLTIAAGEIAEEFEGKRLVFSEINSEKSLFSNYMVRSVIEGGNKITYEILPGANLKYVNSYFVGWMMAIVAFQKGQTAVHCSALSDENGVIMISGESGAGKSTLCAHFLERGFDFMADDIAVTEIKDGKAIAYPTFPYQKLCRNVVDAKGLDYRNLIYVDEDKDKFLVPVKNRFNDKPTSVNCLIFLARNNKEEVICRELSGIEKFIICNKATFFNRLFGNENMPAKAGALCLDLASTIRAYVISRPDGIDTQSEVNRLADEIADGRFAG